jgi:hypothetical protein
MVELTGWLTPPNKFVKTLPRLGMVQLRVIFLNFRWETMRIDKNTLRDMRNVIPIDDMIKSVLNMEHRHREGHLRFLCPDCCDLHTSTNHKTNLARCFICQKNYNPIDLYMKVNRTDFKQATTVLSRMLPFYLNAKKLRRWGLACFLWCLDSITANIHF